MLLSYVVSCAFFLCVVQADLEVLFEDAICDVHNTDYVGSDCTLDIMEDSEYGNYLSVHIEVKKKIPSLIASINLVGMDRTGEYTQDVGISLTTDVCETLVGPPNVAHVFVKALGLKPGECPPEPGVYGEKHFVIDSNSGGGLPESFPDGKYVINLSVLDDDVLILTCTIYISIM